MKLLQLLGTASCILIMASSVVGRLTPTSAVMATKERHMQESCTDCSETQFCGTDGQCHDYSCQNWFQSGGWNKEEIESNITLACEDYADGNEEGNYAVVYGCSGYSDMVIPEGEGYGQGFNQKCIATVEMQLFECYDLKPDTDVSYFLSLANSSTPRTCVDPDGLDYPEQFIYQIITASIQDPTNHYIINSLNSTSYDASLAALGMYAIATDLTLAPSPVPTVAPPTSLAPDPTSGAPIRYPFGVLATLMGFMVVPIMMQV